jgi:class 3 adenylate cyclase
MRGSAVAKRSEPTQNIEPVRRDEAERRQLTVMFCDLVASMAHLKRCAPGILYPTHIHEGGAPWLS